MKKQIYAPEAIDFVTVSAELCKLLENTADSTREDFLQKASRILPLLYVKATLLPDVESLGIVTLPQYVQEEDYEFVRNGVWSLLKGNDEYLEMGHDAEMRYSAEPEFKTLSEQLADIYQDLRNFVAVYADGNEAAMAEALAEAKDNFLNIWGEKLVSVMRPIHDMAWAHPDNSNDND